MYSPFAFVVPFLVVSLQPTLSAAFSWQFTAPPKQCSNLAISIIGSDGQPPYRVLIIPSGPTPLANKVDPRPVIDQAFNGDSTSISFPINYPANSHFVAVVSDANGFGMGGASVETMVANSDDSSCFDSTKSWSPSFDYGVGKDNQLMQCQSTFVWWDSTKSQGTASFVGVIPGGQCFSFPESNISTDPALGKTFTWTPDIQGGTTLLIVGGDNHGMGTGGSAPFTVQFSSDTTCLNSGSPSSTPGVPAGSLQTNAATSATTTSITTLTITRSTTGVSTSKAVGTGTSKKAGAGTTGDAIGASSTSTTAGASPSNAAGASANYTTEGPNIGVIIPAAIGGIIGFLIVIALVVWCLLSKCRGSRPTRPPLPYVRQANSIATGPEDALVHYQPELPAFSGAGTYNHEYAYSGQGDVDGMVLGRGVIPPPLGGSLTSGSEVRMPDTSSQIRSSWYGQPPLRDISARLSQTTGLTSVMSGGSGGVYDMSSQRSSRHLAPPLSQSSLQGTRPELLRSRSRLASAMSGGDGGGGNGGEYDISSQTGSTPGTPMVSSSRPSFMRGGRSMIPREDMVPEEPPPAFFPQNSPDVNIRPQPAAGFKDISDN